MKAATLLKIEKTLRPLAMSLPPKWIVYLHSKGRIYFTSKLKKEVPSTIYTPPSYLERTLWGLKFQCPLLNAAGMFKDGEGYDMTAMQGAGGYLGGTGTSRVRSGNTKNRVHLPFCFYPKSGSASNWLGLPNDGDSFNCVRVSKMGRLGNCPIGWSLAGSPGLSENDQLHELVDSLFSYTAAGVDFIEINESCPNTNGTQYKDLERRLRYIKEHYIDKRPREVPLIVKMSLDMHSGYIPAVMDLLFELGFNGINLGNSSQKYEMMRQFISMDEQPLFDFFTQEFGGGYTGRGLKDISLHLAGDAAAYLKKGPPSQEFHVIRTGGIYNRRDIRDSDNANISLNEWFTGYRYMFNECGHDVYRVFFSEETHA